MVLTPISNIEANLTRVSPVSKVTMNPRESRPSQWYEIKKPSDKPFSEVLADEISYLSPPKVHSLPSNPLHSLDSLRIHYINNS